jgi:hypothetical protein
MRSYSWNDFLLTRGVAMNSTEREPVLVLVVETGEAREFG